jgi:hypothetical protein
MKFETKKQLSSHFKGENARLPTPDCTHLTATGLLYHCPKCFAQLTDCTEIGLQKACKMAFDMLFPNCILIHHQNNAATRGAGAKNKALGVREGMPDFQVIMPQKTFFIEMKMNSGSLSDVQFDVYKKLTSLGHDYFVAYSLRQFINICRKQIKN